MADFKLPLSGNVTQTINPWSWMFSGLTAEVGQVNVYMGSSADPELERKILDQVGTYGRQIGQIGDALKVLLRRLDQSTLTPEERDAIVVLEAQLVKVDHLKRQASVSPTLDLATMSLFGSASSVSADTNPMSNL